MSTSYVFDRSLSKRLALCLSVLLPDEDDEDDLTIAHRILHLADLGHDGEEHSVWIPKLATDKHIAVTCLTSSRRKPVSNVMAACGLRAVHLADSFSQLTCFQQAHKLTGWWERIVAQSYRLKAGECIVVAANGTISDK